MTRVQLELDGPFRNRQLFSDHYLQRYLEGSGGFPIPGAGLDAILDKLSAIYQTAGKNRIFDARDERKTEEKFILPVLGLLGFTVDVQPKLRSALGRSRPDYALFESQAAGDAAATFRDSSQERYYGGALAIAEAKYWGRPLNDTVQEDRTEKGDATRQIVRYLYDVNALAGRNLPWGILTNGKQWRLLCLRRQPTERHLEIDLEDAILKADRSSIQRFLFFFGRDAFLRDPVTNRTRLDELLRSSAQASQKIGDRLRNQIFGTTGERGAFEYLATGFHTYRQRELGIAAETPESLREIFLGTLTLLYRILFLLYAESPGRELLPIGNSKYRERSLGALREAVLRDREKDFLPDDFDYWHHLDRLFRAIAKGNPKLDVPHYNGGLFAGSDAERPELGNEFLATHKIANAHLREALLRLCFDREDELFPGQQTAYDYADLGVRQLGDAYEGLIEFRLRVAEIPLVEHADGSVSKWVPAGEGEVPDRNPGDLYIENDRHERKTTGSYYTPDDLVSEIVERTLVSVLEARFQEARRLIGEWAEAVQESKRLRSVASRTASEERIAGLAGRIYDTVFGCRVCDPAMGSGHFLVEAVDVLTDRIAAFLAEVGENPVLDRIHRDRDKILAELKAEEFSEETLARYGSRLKENLLLRRMILKRCVYGVDLNPMAVELAKVSLWLHCFTLGAPLSFLDHHLKAGNSLIGTSAAEIEEAVSSSRGGGAGLLFGSAIVGMKQAAAAMIRVGRLPDLTPEEVKRSEREFSSARTILQPYRRLLDLWVSQHFVTGDDERGVVTFFKGGALKSFEGGWEARLRPAEARLLRAAKDLRAELRFFHFEIEFPEVFLFDFDGNELAEPGFDVVIGNPPWERIKLQENEFFAERSYEISRAPTAAKRKALIERLKKSNGGLFAEYTAAKTRADHILAYGRDSGRFPLMGRGDTNYYALFAELALNLLSAGGRAGLLTPSGIATDKSTSDFFRKLVEERRLQELYDFENKKVFFPDVHASFKFSIIVFGGTRAANETASCGFFLHSVAEIQDSDRVFPLGASDFALFNPNTKTCPIFRTRRDAELTRKIYENAGGVLLNRSDPAGNPWGVSFLRMFDMTNDSGLFKTKADLERAGFWLGDGNIFSKGEERYLPL